MTRFQRRTNGTIALHVIRINVILNSPLQNSLISINNFKGNFIILKGRSQHPGYPYRFQLLRSITRIIKFLAAEMLVLLQTIRWLT